MEPAKGGTKVSLTHVIHKIMTPKPHDASRQLDTENPDIRKHHTVNVSYLRAWQENPDDKKGKISLGLLGYDGSIAHQFLKKPSEVFHTSGYHDLSKINKILGLQTPNRLLEDVLAIGSEKAFLNARRNTLDKGVLPSGADAAWLAEYSLLLCLRSPKYDSLVAQIVLSQGWDAKTASTILDPATRIFHAMVSGCREMAEKHCFVFVEADKSNFITSDTPCWIWYTNGAEYSSIANLPETNEKVRNGKGEIHYICPITPRFALLLMPQNGRTAKIEHIKNNPDLITQINKCVTLSARRFIVNPPLEIFP